MHSPGRRGAGASGAVGGGGLSRGLASPGRCFLPNARVLFAAALAAGAVRLMPTYDLRQAVHRDGAASVVRPASSTGRVHLKRGSLRVGIFLRAISSKSSRKGEAKSYFLERDLPSQGNRHDGQLKYELCQQSRRVCTHMGDFLPRGLHRSESLQVNEVSKHWGSQRWQQSRRVCTHATELLPDGCRKVTYVAENASREYTRELLSVKVRRLID